MRIALVLGSGGARGYAHIGVIDELKARGHEIVAIAGTSMGAVIGGLEAAGGLQAFSQWAQSLTYFSMLRQMDVTLTGAGMVKADRIIEKINEFCGNALIEDLPIPFTAVATDITAYREVWFQRGPLASAIRASMALPGFITPVVMNDHILVDGGVYNPVPVAPTFAVPSDLTVAVSLGGRPGMAEPSVSNADAADVSDDAGRLSDGGIGPLRREVFRELAARFSGPRSSAVSGTESDSAAADSSVRSAATGSKPSAIESAEMTLSTSDVLHMSLTAMQEMIERFRAAATPVNVQITVPRGVASTYDFHRAREIIAVGRGLARDAFDAAGI